MTFTASNASSRTATAPSLLLEMRRVGFEGDGECDPVQSIDLSVHRGEAVALVGAGRSTIIRLMAGELKASKGTISRLADGSSRHVVRMSRGGLEVGGRFSIPDLASEVFPDSADRDVTHRWVRSGLQRVGFHIDERTDVVEVSDATAVQRLALARAVMARPNLIVADEPFTTLPRNEVAGLLEALVSYRSRRSAVVVCTNRFDVAEMCSRVVDLGQSAGAMGESIAG